MGEHTSWEFFSEGCAANNKQHLRVTDVQRGLLLWARQHMTPGLPRSGFTSPLKPGVGPERRTMTWREDDPEIRAERGSPAFVRLT